MSVSEMWLSAFGLSIGSLIGFAIYGDAAFTAGMIFGTVALAAIPSVRALLSKGGASND